MQNAEGIGFDSHTGNRIITPLALKEGRNEALDYMVIELAPHKLLFHKGGGRLVPPTPRSCRR